MIVAHSLENYKLQKLTSTIDVNMAATDGVGGTLVGGKTQPPPPPHPGDPPPSGRTRDTFTLVGTTLDLLRKSTLFSEASSNPSSFCTNAYTVFTASSPIMDPTTNGQRSTRPRGSDIGFTEALGPRGGTGRLIRAPPLRHKPLNCCRLSHQMCFRLLGSTPTKLTS
jgi:hypothetical protein